MGWVSPDTRADELGLWLGVHSTAPDGEEEWAPQSKAQPQHMADLSKLTSAFAFDFIFLDSSLFFIIIPGRFTRFVVLRDSIFKTPMLEM